MRKGPWHILIAESWCKIQALFTTTAVNHFEVKRLLADPIGALKWQKNKVTPRKTTTTHQHVAEMSVVID